MRPSFCFFSSDVDLKQLNAVSEKTRETGRPTDEKKVSFANFSFFVIFLRRLILYFLKEKEHKILYFFTNESFNHAYYRQLPFSNEKQIPRRKKFKNSHSQNVWRKNKSLLDFCVCFSCPREQIEVMRTCFRSRVAVGFTQFKEERGKKVSCDIWHLVKKMWSRKNQTDWKESYAVVCSEIYGVFKQPFSNTLSFSLQNTLCPQTMAIDFHANDFVMKKDSTEANKNVYFQGYMCVFLPEKNSCSSVWPPFFREIASYLM